MSRVVGRSRPNPAASTYGSPRRSATTILLVPWASLWRDFTAGVQQARLRAYPYLSDWTVQRVRRPHLPDGASADREPFVTPRKSVSETRHHQSCPPARILAKRKCAPHFGATSPASRFRIYSRHPNSQTCPLPDVSGLLFGQKKRARCFGANGPGELIHYVPTTIDPQSAADNPTRGGRACLTQPVPRATRYLLKGIA
jgi:hypothetical protein